LLFEGTNQGKTDKAVVRIKKRNDDKEPVKYP